jgi:hypothetical protein
MDIEQSTLELDVKSIIYVLMKDTRMKLYSIYESSEGMDDKDRMKLEEMIKLIDQAIKKL